MRLQQQQQQQQQQQRQQQQLSAHCTSLAALLTPTFHSPHFLVLVDVVAAD
jgi:hypothetical protein